MGWQAITSGLMCAGEVRLSYSRGAPAHMVPEQLSLLTWMVISPRLFTHSSLRFEVCQRYVQMSGGHGA